MRRLAALAILVLLPALARAQDDAPRGAEVRPALAALERALDRAVSQVAPPSPMALLAGPGGSHGYHLEGVGAFFVLPPRRLPSSHGVFFFQASPGPEGEELAERMAALHAEAERMNAEAERAYRRVRREIRIRLSDEAGAREAGAASRGDEASDEPHAPAPPWRFWFELDAPPLSRETRASADELVGAVRGAITAALESDAARLPILGPDELVAVAVDFVADPFFMSGEGRTRTLVVRVRSRDLEARRVGDLNAEELRERILSEEY